MPTLLALDAGGTTTRAVALTSTGDVLGRGHAGPGNPTSAGIKVAVASIGMAIEAASAAVVGPVELAVVAMAGERSEGFVGLVTDRIRALGVRRVVLQHDLLALFCSGSWSADGYALVAGTGTVAARLAGGTLATVVGGRGWLLGDAGGGFWIGRRVARAVVAALDGQGPPTALSALVLPTLGIPPDPSTDAERRTAIAQVVSAVYARRPVALAELAPLAFSRPDDPVARAILVHASRALADLLDAVRVPGLDGPIVVGGSVMVRGMLTAATDLAAHLVPTAAGRSVVPVPDGLVGAAVLALREVGVPVDEPMFARLQTRIIASA